MFVFKGKKKQPEPITLWGRFKPSALVVWHMQRAFECWEAQAMPATCSSCVQSAAVAFGEVYHSLLKTMQIVKLDYFLCHTYFLDPLRGHSSSFLAANPCNKVQ